MGADPGETYVALQIPPGFPEAGALELVRGAAQTAARYGFAILGGDVVAAPVLAVSVTAVGWVESSSSLPTRDRARPGDLVGVTGSLGGAAAALAVMEGRAPGAASLPSIAAAVARARDPQPRLREGRALADTGVSAMIDISDGLAADAAHIGTASGARLAIRLDALPLAEGVSDVAAELGEPPWRLAAGGGEDYELCFCAPSDARERIDGALATLGGAAVTWIGSVTAGGEPGAAFSDQGGEDVRIEGYEHRW
jgi:thiamine-monophosphate kinase